MPYEVRLEIFEGPLDLLLHLIHRNEVSITDIPIALITSQYLDTVSLMQSLNLDVAGEYLVMAAYLTFIKSQMLLPPVRDDDADESGPQEDPRDDLVAHLLEYKRYKESAECFGSLPLLGRDVFAREASDTRDEPVSAAPIDVSIDDLLAALRHVLLKAAREHGIELQPERLHVKDRMRLILERLETVDRLRFDELLNADESRENVLVTFLALLELMKLRLVRVYQTEPFGTILVVKAEDER